MKKIKLIPISLLGLSLAFGLITFAKAPEKAKPVHATPTGTFKVGTQDLASGTTYNIYGGTAKLETSTTEFTLTLNGINTNGTAYEDTTNHITSALTILNVDVPVVIKVKGTNTFYNNNSNQALIYGLRAESSNNVSLSIVGEGSDPTINFYSRSSTAGYSEAFYASLGPSSNVNISNCRVNAIADTSAAAWGMEIAGQLNINEGAIVTSTSNGSNLNNNSAIGIVTNKYVHNAGEVTAMTGNSTGQSYSYGLQVKSGNVVLQSGKLTVQAGDTVGKSSSGIRINLGKLSLVSGEFSAKSGTITSPIEGNSSFGVYLGSPDDDNIVEVKSDLKSFYAHGKDRAVNGKILSDYLGYVDNAENIDSVANPATFAAGTKAYMFNNTMVFRKIQFTKTDTGTITYDGGTHNALTIAVTTPASGYTIRYSTDGGSNWSTTNPVFDEASDSAYVVNYEITCKLYAPETGSVQLFINKADSSVATAPTKVDDFTEDGNFHLLVNTGTASGGVLVYSVNGGAYSTDVPMAKEPGTYSISYKVQGDTNHNDTAPVSLGNVVIAAQPTPTPEPDDSDTPEPIAPSKKGLSAGAVVGIVLGSLVLVLGAAYLVLLFLLNKWIKVGDKAVRVMRFALGNKDGKERYLSFKLKFEYREKHEVFSTKDEALK